MAGGMTRGAGRLPLHQRVRAEPPAEELGPGRHCWVTGGAGAADVLEKRPGLLVEWRRDGDAWEGRVVYMSLQAPTRWVLVEEWIASSRLSPA